jgi:cytochrome c biogenesis protein CcdA
VLDIILAFAAGVLTVAAPCVLPMLPIILGAPVGPLQFHAADLDHDRLCSH